MKYCILGAGPSGLAFAAALKAAGETSFVVLEKEAVAGGLCRSAIVDGSPLDIGGGHFLDLSRTHVVEFLLRYMPRSEWNEFVRVSLIQLRGVEVAHPLEGNLWQLPEEMQREYLASLRVAGCVVGTAAPEGFEDWIRWKLGARIADDYMLPYNRKMWCRPLNDLGTYWLHKLPDVSYEESVRSCTERRPGGALPAHGRFLYPKRHGYGEVWRRIAADLGDLVVGSYAIHALDPIGRTVNRDYHYERLVTTIPWPAWLTRSTLPDDVAAAIRQLVHTTVDVDYQPETVATPSHWTYVPDETVSYHRRLFRSNFCPGSRGHWTETNALRSGAPAGFRHRNDYAYPVNTRTKPAAIETIERWARAQAILPLGRWGRWEHVNSDVAVDLALKAADAALHA